MMIRNKICHYFGMSPEEVRNERERESCMLARGPQLKYHGYT